MCKIGMIIITSDLKGSNEVLSAMPGAGLVLTEVPIIICTLMLVRWWWYLGGG